MRRKSGIGSAILPMGYLVSPNHKVGREKENNMDKSHLAIELIRKDLIQAFRVEVVGSQVVMKINTTLDKGWLLARLLGGALVPVVDELWEVQVAL
jgi:predicted DCC family thiol-disulfide oxidoreductase YuxK